MAAKQQFGRHPMLDDVMRALRKGDDGQLIFDPNELAQFQKVALSINRGEDLYTLVGALLSFAGYLKERANAPVASDALFEMVRPVIEKLEKAVHNDAEGAADRAQKLTKAHQREDDALHRQPTTGGLAPKPAGGVGFRRH